nr:hypothetical protein [Tanacetum cinerariifolium]
MESLSPQVVSAAKLPILNPNEFDLWKMRIEQYFLMTDYSLWEVILNGDSPIPTRVVDRVIQLVAPTTAEQRLAKKNELKAQGTLLMALPDKHQLKFNIHKDAKSLMEAIEKRFGGNTETKKVQKTLLKQQYENFSGSSSESLDQIYDRLQKLISQLKILDLEDQSLDDLFNNLKIFEVKVKSSSSTSPATQNIAFVSLQNTDSTNESVSTVTSVSAASTKVPVSALPNVDNDDLKQIDADDLEEMDLKWQMAMLTIRARIFLQRSRRNLRANGTTSIGFDMSKVKCYNCHKRGHFARECKSPRDTRNKDTQRRNVLVETSTSNALVSQCDGVAPCSKACSKAYATLQSYYDKLTNDLMKSQFDVLSYKTGLESIEARLVVYQQNENVFEEDIKLLKLDVMLRDKALTLSKLLASQITDKTGLGYDNQVFNSTVFDYDELISSESDVSMPTSPVHDRYKSRKGYHVVPSPYTGTFMPPKPDLVFYDAPIDHETVPTVLNVEPITTKPNKDLSQSNRPSALIIEDWVSDSEDEYEGEPMPTQKTPSFVQTSKHVKTPRTSVKPIEHPTPVEHLRKDIPNTRGHRHSWNRKACFVCKSLTHLIKDCDYYEKKMVQTPAQNHAMQGNHQHYARMTHSHPNTHVIPTTVLTRHTSASMTLKQFDYTDVLGRSKSGNISYLSNFEEINRGYDAFGGNPKGGKITSKGKIRTCKFDFDDVYFVKELKFNLFSVLQMCDKKNNVLFTDTECIVLSFDFKLPDENHVLLRVPKENNMYNVDIKNIVPSEDLTCLFVKATLYESNLWHRRLGHINFKTMNKLVKGNQPNSSACIQENLNAGTVGKEAKSVQQYVLLSLWSSGSKDPQNTYAAAFEVKEPESAVHVSPSSCDKPKKHDDKTKREAKGKSLTAAGPSNNSVSLNFELGRKSSFVDPSQYPDDPDMPALKEITYSDDKKDVGAEADFSNLETNITVKEPKKVHHALKDPSWIESMQEELLQFKMQKVWVLVDLPKGFEDPDYPNKVYKVVKALYGLHQAFRAWYETSANYLLENGFQRGKIDQILFIKKQKGDILLVQMSLLGELTFFLGLQVKQKQDGIFISQDKYVAKILRKFGLTDRKLASTPIDTEKPLLKDPDGEDVDVHTYRSMIGSLMYLTLSRPDIMFAVCACAHFQVTLKALHLHVVKRIFKYLKGKLHLGLWYLKDSPFNLVAYSDSDYARASLDRMSTTGGCQFLDRKKVIIIVDSIRQALRLDDADSVDYLPMKRFLLSWRGWDTSLFDGMLVPQQAQNVEDVAEDEDAVNEVSTDLTPPSPTPATPSSPPQPKHIPSSPHAEAAQLSPPPQPQPSHHTKISMTLLSQLLETYATLNKEVANLEQDKEGASKKGEIAKLVADEDVTFEDVAAEETKDADVQGRLEESQAKVYHLDLEHADKVLSMQETNEAESDKVEEVIEVVIATKLMKEVVTTAATTITTATTITAASVPKASAPRRRMSVIIQDPKEEATASEIIELEAELNANINWNDVVDQVKRKERQDNIVMRYQALKRKPVTEAQARKNMMVYLKNMAGFKMDFFKDRRRGKQEKSENLEQRVAKKQKINEETEELKTHLQIVPNNEDDVYTKATPIALKVHVIEYQIHHEHKKPYYKINKADGTHQLFLSFITLLRNFDREDLKMLWKLVQERFQFSEPKNFSEDFLLNTLKTMFEKPNVEASI